METKVSEMSKFFTELRRATDRAIDTVKTKANTASNRAMEALEAVKSLK